MDMDENITIMIYMHLMGNLKMEKNGMDLDAIDMEILLMNSKKEKDL